MPASSTPPAFHSRTAEKETLHTLSLLEPHLAGASSVLDVGCGSGYVAWQLGQRFPGAAVATVDIGDFRRVPTPDFRLYDGLRLPYPNDAFDVVVFSFVLHHVPDVRKPLLLAEARRVARHRLVVLEDTPQAPLDRLASWWHGTWFRRRIGSRERFGFLAPGEWTRLLTEVGLRPRLVQPLSRWCRSLWQPFARSLFVIDVGKAQ
jgi:ubiquinone/menaquinone biosynthesis C-methylase UbiE